MEIFWTVCSYIFSFKVWLILCLITLVSSINTFVKEYINQKNEYLAKAYEYDEEKIISHLDYIINENLNLYHVIHIAPMDIYYINSKIQEDIIAYLIDKVPSCISPSLMNKLALIYHPNYITKFIGERIYIIVVDFVLNYNLQKAPEKAANNGQSSSQDFNNMPSEWQNEHNID